MIFNIIAVFPFNFKKLNMAKDNIRAQINALEIGHVASFPLDRYEYVLSCRTRLQTSTGKKFSSKKNKKTGLVQITRI